MLDFFIIILIGSSIGYFWGRTHHNRYGLSHLLNGLIGLVGALLATFFTVWLIDNSNVPNPYAGGRVWLAASVGAFLLVWLAGFLRSRQYE